MLYKKRVPVRERDTESRLTCDFCGNECVLFHHNEVSLEARLGNVFPEGDFRKVETFDCCPSCWVKKVRPALEGLGGRCYKYDIDDGRLPSAPFDPAPRPGG